MIKAFCGRFGTGKTLSMVGEAYKWLPKGIKVVSNTAFRYRYFQFKPFKEILKGDIKKLDTWGTWEYKDAEMVYTLDEYFFKFKTYTNTIFCMDEAGIWLDSYKWNKVPDDVYNRFFQIRKVNIHLLYTTQFFNFVVKKLRQMTDVVVECEAPVRHRPDPMIPYDRGKPYIIRNISYNPKFYEQQVWSETLEKKFIEGRHFIWGWELGHVFSAFDTNKEIK